MKIEEKDRKRLRDISIEYIDVRGDITQLESEIEEILQKKNQLIYKLKDLRIEEISLINKIEEYTGEKVTQEILTEIFNS